MDNNFNRGVDSGFATVCLKDKAPHDIIDITIKSFYVRKKLGRHRVLWGLPLCRLTDHQDIPGTNKPVALLWLSTHKDSRDTLYLKCRSSGVKPGLPAAVLVEELHHLQHSIEASPDNETIPPLPEADQICPEFEVAIPEAYEDAEALIRCIADLLLILSSPDYIDSIGRFTTPFDRKRSLLRMRHSELHLSERGERLIITDNLRDMIAGYNYHAEPNDGGKEARRLSLRLNDLAEDSDPAKLEPFHADLFGSKFELWAEPPMAFDYGFNMHFAGHNYLNVNTTFLDCAPIYSGIRAFFGPGVDVYPPGHPLDTYERRDYEFATPVEFGDDVWVGGRAIILAGVRIGSDVIIGAGAVVTKDVPSGCVVTGNPGRVCRNVTTYTAKRLKEFEEMLIKSK